jgi:hypothetical protein
MNADRPRMLGMRQGGAKVVRERSRLDAPNLSTSRPKTPRLRAPSKYFRCLLLIIDFPRSRKAFSTKKAALLLTIVLSAPLPLTGCGRSEAYRYKLTLSVDTPEGVKTSSSVVELRYFDVFFPDQSQPHETKGQALYLSLGPRRRPLIALLTRIRRIDEIAPNIDEFRWLEDSPSPVLTKVCLGQARLLDWLDNASLLKRHCHHSIAISPHDLPDLVTFANIDNPNSVILVNPDELTATLGLGISWRAITIEVTDEPLTTAIEDSLPQIVDYKANIPLPSVNSFQYGRDTFLNSLDFIRR